MWQGQLLAFDMARPLDISLPLVPGGPNPNAYWGDEFTTETIRVGSFVGSVAEGGAVNHRKLHLTPHSNGTHTECYGHISPNPEATLDRCLQQFWHLAQVVSISPTVADGDHFITVEQLMATIGASPLAPALIIRTLPNTEDKKQRAWSGTNPPYLQAEVGHWLAEQGVAHLLVDLPSVDREVDEGRLSVHKGFWQLEATSQVAAPERQGCTITELCFVPDVVADGLYLLNLMVTHLRSDASPSRPIIYPLL
jgi:arylformamidase